MATEPSAPIRFQRRYLQNLLSGLVALGVDARLDQTRRAAPCVVVTMPNGGAQQITVERHHGICQFVQGEAEPIASVSALLEAIDQVASPLTDLDR